MSSAVPSPTKSHTSRRSISHKATVLFHRVRDADLAIVEAGHKLASEIHHIFISTPSQEISGSSGTMSSTKDINFAPFGNHEVNICTPRTSSSMVDLPFLPSRNSQLPPSEPCSAVTTPLLSLSSLTPRSSCESIRDWKIDSYPDLPSLVRPQTPEAIPDPWHAKPDVDNEAEERRLLHLESARSVFGWSRQSAPLPTLSALPNLLDGKHRRSTSLASSPLSSPPYSMKLKDTPSSPDEPEFSGVMYNEHKRRGKLNRSHSRFHLSNHRPLRMVKSSINFAIQSFTPAPSHPSSPNISSMPSSPLLKSRATPYESYQHRFTSQTPPLSSPIAVFPLDLFEEPSRCPSPTPGVRKLSPRVSSLSGVRRSSTQSLQLESLKKQPPLFSRAST